MSMFDYFRPALEQRCPVCSRVLREWQGKDGPNGSFVWAENSAHPIDQRASDEVRLDLSAREQRRLPPRFLIYSYDCPDHQPIQAIGSAPDGTWTKTQIQPYGGKVGP